MADESDMSKLAQTAELLSLLKQPSLQEAIDAVAKPAPSVPVSAADAAATAAPAAGAGSVAGTSEGAGAAADSLRPVHRFWDTQPVPKLDADVEADGPIDAPKTVDDIRKEPYVLPSGFEWCTIDVQDSAQLKELYELLRDNYVEDDDCMFRFNYSPEFLLWALTPPHYFKDWIVGVRNTKTGRLIASITGVPANMRVHAHTMLMCEINYLCVHKKLRSKRLAPVLIKEVTRRVNLRGIFQAAYTAGVVLPKPVASCQYFHRNLDPKKLIEIGFSRLGDRMTMTRTIRLYALPETPSIPGIRALEKRDVPRACKLLNDYLHTNFKLHPVYTEDDFRHWFLPRAQVIESYVVESPTTGELTDFLSFYHLPSTVIGHPKHHTLSAVYSYYNVPGAHGMKEIMRDALILAKSRGVDVFNALKLMHNEEVFADLKFGAGDGNLQYYLYNWACRPLENTEMGLVLL